MTKDQENSIFAEILLVEDNLSDEQLILHALSKKNLANKVYTVRDGEEAIDFLLCANKFSHRDNRNLRVVLLDLKLPKIDGLEVLRIIKGNDKTKLLPVVVLTSSNQDPDIEVAYKLGANSYINKPIIFEKFIDVVVQLGFYWAILNAKTHDISCVKEV